MRTGYMAISLAAAVCVIPASFAQVSPVPRHGLSAATGIEADTQQSHGKMSGGLRSVAPEHIGVFVDVPIGRVLVGPESVDGETTYVRRTVAKEGMTIVEVSTTPFVEELAEAGGLVVRPETQPASW